MTALWIALAVGAGLVILFLCGSALDADVDRLFGETPDLDEWLKELAA